MGRNSKADESKDGTIASFVEGCLKEAKNNCSLGS